MRLEALAFAGELTESRRKLLAALAALAELPLARAVSMLAVSAGQAAEVAVDAELSSAPAGPAAEVYTGVLYDRLQLPELPKRSQGRVLIASALWGMVKPTDRIPYYRLSAKARLEGVGGLLVPLSPSWTVRSFAVELGYPLVVVAPPGLGAINHTLLTVESARSVGLKVAAVVLDPWPEDPTPIEADNRETIAAMSGVPVVTLPQLDLTRPETWPDLRLGG